MALSGFKHSVKWREFRSVNQRPVGGKEDAEIIIRVLRFTFRTNQPRGQNCRVTGAVVSIVVNRSGSWVVRSQKNADLLRHEQGHYNITALGTRDLYNQVLGLTAARCPDINRHALRLRQQVQTQINQTNRRYDARTSNGNKATSQRAWDRSIRSAMLNANGTLANLPQ